MSLTPEEADPKPVKVSKDAEVSPEVLDIGKPEDWKVVQSFSGHEHHMVPDPTEIEFEAEKCSICGIGRLIRPKGQAAL